MRPRLRTFRHRAKEVVRLKGATTQTLDPNLAQDFNNEYTGEGGEIDPLQAYVVLSDIQGQQADYDRITQNASL